MDQLLPVGYAFRMKLDTLAERAWLAWHSLPRGPKGDPPGWKGLEAEHGVPGATFSKMFSGKRAEPRGTTVAAMARALHVDAAWLQFGQGEPPKPTGPVPPPPWQEVERIVVREDRYPSRARAAAAHELLRDVDAQAIADVLAEAHDADEDPGELYWFRRMQGRDDEIAARRKGRASADPPDVSAAKAAASKPKLPKRRT